MEAWECDLVIHLKPSFIITTLICCNYLDIRLVSKTFYSRISSGKVGIEASRVELCKSIYPVYVAVNAVTHNCIDKPVVCCNRDSPFWSSLCQWIKPWFWSIPKYNSCYTLTSTKKGRKKKKRSPILPWQGLVTFMWIMAFYINKFPQAIRIEKW